MARTPDRTPGESDEEGIVLETNAVDPVVAGGIRFNGSAFRLRDSIGVFDPRSGGSGITEPNFYLDAAPPTENTDYDVTRSQGRVTQERWRRTVGLATLKTIDYTYTGSRLTSEVRKVFATDGTTIVAQITITYVYVGGQVSTGTVVRNV